MFSRPPDGLQLQTREVRSQGHPRLPKCSRLENVCPAGSLKRVHLLRGQPRQGCPLLKEHLNPTACEGFLCGVRAQNERLQGSELLIQYRGNLFPHSRSECPSSSFSWAGGQYPRFFNLGGGEAISPPTRPASFIDEANIQRAHILIAARPQLSVKN